MHACCCPVVNRAQDIDLLSNTVEKERKNVERGVGGRERKQVGAALGVVWQAGRIPRNSPPLA